MTGARSLTIQSRFFRDGSHRESPDGEIPYDKTDRGSAGGNRQAVCPRPIARDEACRMPFTVELYPSGHRFEAHSGETILEAALRAGRSPAFGCANGSCGECRARIVAGEVERVRFHDYVIADAEKRAGYALLCSTAPRSDLVVESTEASGVDDIAPQRVRQGWPGSSTHRPTTLSCISRSGARGCCATSPASG